MTQYTLYGPALSTYVRTVRMILAETNTPYDLKAVDIFSDRDPAYLAKHPFGKVPTLEVDGETLYETCAIVEYLDTVVGNRAFTPADPMGQARMRQIMAIVDSYLYAPAISTITIQRLIVPSKGGQPDEDAVAAAIPKAKTALEAIEAIASCSPYLLGPTITLADFYLMPVMLYLSKTPEFAAVTSEIPQLNAWWAEVSHRPSFLEVIS
ncbi:glutathione S-transferase family protein [Phormidium tenue]|uniref:glutathione transferase n=1 Tax=Phormidium tenue NIES-30 TaxID=549789 RepID=A0A1U7J148_9CYAN|nr:glutathione S-transferase family protein [Phormidium tenue]MBD2233852.1 glutathione S-transferase family protein [Phormidium tenue FACHB-1052]OKH45647.1 glutathione S-transferase [Phormidium tenue NIES-30]